MVTREFIFRFLLLSYCSLYQASPPKITCAFSAAKLPSVVWGRSLHLPGAALLPWPFQAIPFPRGAQHQTHLTLKIKQISQSLFLHPPCQQRSCFPMQHLLFSICSLMRDHSDTQIIITLWKQGCKWSIDQFVTQVVYSFPSKTSLKGKGKERFLGMAFKWKSVG